MRLLLALTLPLLAAAAPAPPPPASIFLSPMGEPFRSDDSAAEPSAGWFAGADRDGDGALTAAELREDAARFFAALDRDGNSEIGPAEIGRYENEIAPEVQLGLQMRGMDVGGWRGPDSRRRRREAQYEAGLEGAGRYSFLNIPHPVMAADFDLNRGVSRDEFGRAAGQRFLLLDRNSDGRLARAELPPLPQRRTRRQRARDWDERPIPGGPR